MRMLFNESKVTPANVLDGFEANRCSFICDRTRSARAFNNARNSGTFVNSRRGGAGLPHGARVRPVAAGAPETPGGFQNSFFQQHIGMRWHVQIPHSSASNTTTKSKH